MTELERFFRALVEAARATPSGEHQPLTVESVLQEVMPYRSCRRPLGLASVDDYELLLLRLAAGEADLVHTSPAEASEAFYREVREPNPELEVLRLHGDAGLTLRPAAVRMVLTTSPDRAYAPPEEPPAPPEPVPLEHREVVNGEPEITEVETPGPRNREEESESCCAECGAELPGDRVVNFCPRCGQGRSRLFCPICREPAQPDWRFCIVCGHPLGVR